ncbi:MAG TPA: bifunctional UDP-sugar hydrolase/5'-nucleotidase [Bacilli bacterium]|nr:bifunctional UDP-sugar hydrolase/5'-nucleotidase [Bacilli bacterium]
MNTYKYHIYYTSDVHGSLSALDEATGQKTKKGLSRIANYLKKQEGPYMLLDNGDTIQGSSTLSRWAANISQFKCPIAKVMNEMNYQYINVGNHDFNYGQDVLNSYVNALQGTILCCNVINDQQNPVFKPYDILILENNIKIGIIGAVTHYIPHWEKPNQIQGLTFLDAYLSIKDYVALLRPQVDFLVVLYHGGFEKDVLSGLPIGRNTDENQGFLIASTLDIDLLLTGHQHIKISNKVINGTYIMQTSHSAMDFGHAEINFILNNNRWSIESVMTELIPSCDEEDSIVLELISNDLKETQVWLDKPIGSIHNSDLLIEDAFLSRKNTHPIYQLINDMQLQTTNAMISAASLPNQAIGLHQSITIRDIEATLIYPNSLYVIEITGKTLKLALEKSASYFALNNDEITVNPSFINPKVEHYNYDVYANITYSISVSKPIGSRITNLAYKGNPITDYQVFTLALNNYRAIGGGDYHMFENSNIIAEYEIPLSTLLQDYIKSKKVIIPKIANHITIIT